MIAGLAATAGVLLLAIAPRIVREQRAARHRREHRERFHRAYVIPLREFARDRER
jgi:hypothetical protein